MKPDKKKLLLLLTGVFFAIAAVLQIIYCIMHLGYGVNIISLIPYAIGFAVVSFSCFKFNPKLLLAGLFFIIGAATRIFDLIRNIYETTDSIYYYGDFDDFVEILFEILGALLPICGFVLLGLYCFSQLNESAPIQTSSADEMEQSDNPTPANTNDTIERLEKLKKLQLTGAITEEEFEAKKKQLLGL